MRKKERLRVLEEHILAFAEHRRATNQAERAAIARQQWIAAALHQAADAAECADQKATKDS